MVYLRPTFDVPLHDGRSLKEWVELSAAAREEALRAAKERRAANKRSVGRGDAYLYGFLAIVSALIAWGVKTGFRAGLFGFAACVLAGLAIWTYRSTMGD
jgi:hypothetical protein